MYIYVYVFIQPQICRWWVGGRCCYSFIYVKFEFEDKPLEILFYFLLSFTLYTYIIYLYTILLLFILTLDDTIIISFIILFVL